mgnify:CR=1 FL=1
MPATRHLLAPLSLASLIFSAALPAADWQYLTVPGDTLIGIGKSYLKNPNDWPKVQAENKVDLPKHLPSHTHLRIPLKLLKQTPAPVEVTAVTGNVRVKVEQGFQSLKVGDQLRGGESVLTGPSSSASFRFADGTALTQQAGSKLVFGRLVGFGKTGMVSTEISLESGRLEASAGKQIGPAGGFSVRTPVAVAGLRGTEFRLKVSEDGRRMQNEVTEGVVAVSGQGRQVSVAAGYGTYTEAGKAPVPPRALLAAGALNAAPGKVQRFPMQFQMAPMPGAAAWRSQVASDPEFRSVLLDDVFATPVGEWATPLPDGRYYLRVRGIDAAGLEGFSTTYPFEIDVHPIPPTPISPALDERLYQRQATLAWSAVPDAQGYLLQLAPTPEFQNGVIEQRLPPVVQHQVMLPEGQWHWRVASLDEAGMPHLFSPYRAFRVQPLPVAPADAQANARDGEAHFTWGAVRGADKYGFEVKRDEGSPVVNAESNAPAIAAPLEPGRYAWRVRSLEADGQAGDWSAANVVILPPKTPQTVRVDVKAQPANVSWQGAAMAYRVEVAADAAFSQIVHRGESATTHSALPELQPGEYWVRVTALGEAGSASPASAPVAFTLERNFPWWLFLLPLLAL